MAAQIKSRLSLIAFSLLYGISGLVHFINPAPYLTVIPDWLVYGEFINYASGLIELVLAVFVWFPLSRKRVSQTTIILLSVFIISHVQFILQDSCAGELCLPAWIGWVRLIVIHPLLMYWAYKIRYASWSKPNFIDSI